MQPDKGIVNTCRCSDRLSTIPEDHKTPTHQSADTDNAPREPLFTDPLQTTPTYDRGKHQYSKLGFVLSGSIDIIGS